MKWFEKKFLFNKKLMKKLNKILKPNKYCGNCFDYNNLFYFCGATIFNFKLK